VSEARKSYEAEQAQKKREAYERAQQAKAQEAAAKEATAKAAAKAAAAKVAQEAAQKAAAEAQAKARKPVTPTPPAAPQDLMADIAELKKDADKLQSQIGVTGKQQEELKVTIKEIEATRDKIRGKPQTIKEIEETVAKIKEIKQDLTEKRARGSWYGERPTIDFHKITQSLYEKSNYPTKAEIDKALEEHGMAAMREFGPKSVGQALTRLAYGAAEMIEGGVTEATLGLAYDPKSSERPLALPLQVAGGLLTPTALDYAFGAVLTKLGITKAGRKLIRKLGGLLESGDDIPTSLTIAEAKQFEKIMGTSGITTSDLRKLDKKTLKTIQDVAEYYEKHPAQFTAGAAYVPPEQLFYDEIIDNLGWDVDEYIDFLKTYGDRLNVDKNFLAGVLLRVNLNDVVKVLDATAVEIPSDYKDRPASPGLVLREETKTILDEALTPLPEEVPDTIPPGTIPKEIPKTIPEKIPGTPPTPPPEPVPEEPTPPPPEEPTVPFLPKSKPEERRDIRLRLFSGPKEKYRVKFSYPKGQSQTLTVEARSFPEAVNRAQRSRRGNRYLPSVVDITKVRG